MMQFARHTSWTVAIEHALEGVPYPAQPEGLYEPISYVLSMGGKRLRPTLLLTAYSLYKDNAAEAMPAAIGLETYHNHTLLHDDLMDNADMRRGMPTVHKKWNDNTAVLSGDTMLIMAFQHIMQCPCNQQAEVLDLFARTAREICEGQQYDVNFETRTDVTEAEYIEMIRLKTSVLLACATKMGAMIADAPAADCKVLYRFAERIGLAFQLQDDYLDVYGDPAVFGKKIGGDILCGKKLSCLSMPSNVPTMHKRHVCCNSWLTVICLPNKKLPRLLHFITNSTSLHLRSMPSITIMTRHIANCKNSRSRLHNGNHCGIMLSRCSDVKNKCATYAVY